MGERHKSFDWGEWGPRIFWLVVIGIIVFICFGDNIRNFFSGDLDEGKTTCVDATSYDHNWDNDMRCTRSNGSVFYTSYEGARRAEE